MLDKLPAWARHFAIVLAVALLTIFADKIPSIADQLPAGLAPILAALVSALLLALTPLTRQYGVGGEDDSLAAVDPDVEQAVSDFSETPYQKDISSVTEAAIPDPNRNIANPEGDF